jgi:hypothetical protein
MNSIFQFGEKLDAYEVRVLNEREVRAAAGILFFFAMITFLTAWLTGNFQPTRVFVVAFLIDFTIRLFVNPKFAPSMILGRFAVRTPREEWVGAPQKRFAWAIGFALALTMFYLVVLNNVVGPVNLIVCLICLLLLFFETAFGICVGCSIYNLFNREKAQLCPGGICDISQTPAAKPFGLAPLAIVALYLGMIYGAGTLIAGHNAGNDLATNRSTSASAAPAPVEGRCKVPDFAKALGHEEKWKLHNNCK